MIKGLFILLGTVPFWASAQKVEGMVSYPNGTPAVEASVFIEGTSIETKTDSQGRFSLGALTPGSYRIVAFMPEYETVFQDITVEGNRVQVTFHLKEISQELSEVTVEDSRTPQTVNWLQSVSGSAIYEAKKSELIRLDQVIGNKAANVSRQVYARVPGLNIWENDGAGLQLGIGGRGLSPNRTSNFNTRQNGYDISADALGYPESYYTPPVQALDRIEIVRGAAGLQYGTQFGGMLNFVFNEGPKEKPVEVNLIQTAGSFGLFNSFNSVGGTVGKVNYYSFYTYKRSDGWRPNSGLEQHNAFGSVTYQFSPFLSVRMEHTHMSYLAQQPGGLTDFQFYQNPRQSNRERNWFRVGWDLTAMEWNFRVSSALKFNNRTFHLLAGRDAVGNLGSLLSEDDPAVNRNLLKDEYRNVGNELRAIAHYSFLGRKSILVVGNRLYFGHTNRSQGEANSEYGPNFSFLNPTEPEDSDFKFPNQNVAFFAENIFNLSEKWSIIPGIRYEYIGTEANGYYFDRRYDNAGNIIYNKKEFERKSRGRDFMMAGIGFSYKKSERTEGYANFSQNYKSINFNDIRVDNPSLTVDENIGDERGFNVDMGIRGNNRYLSKYDVSIFYLAYKNRIGNMVRDYQYRTNIGDAGIYGIESYLESSVLKWLGIQDNKYDVSIFLNSAIIRSEYLRNADEWINGNEVELVPRVNTKTGLTFTKGSFGTSLLFTYLSSQYSDAGNSTKPSSSAVDGKIPAYHVMDVSTSYKWKRLTFESGVNNLTNTSYFTRRASGYPGPGIIPSDGRSFYLTIGVKI